MRRLSTEGKQKHLILFFDINGTMFMGDTAKGESLRVTALKSIAEKHVAVWDEALSAKTATFKDFVEKILAPGEKRDERVQQLRQHHYDNFIAFLTARKHPLLATVKSDFDLIMTNLDGSPIPRSFIKMVDHLNRSNIPYTIVFRTFGDDLAEVKAVLAEKLNLTLSFDAKFFDGKLHSQQGGVIESPQAMLDTLQPGMHGAWSDNFKDWQAAKQYCTGGKPYPLTRSGDKVVMICDDNVSKEIIRIVEANENHSRERQQQIQAELIDQGLIVSVDSYEVCINENYFIEKIAKVYQLGHSYQRDRLFAVQANETSIQPMLEALSPVPQL